MRTEAGVIVRQDCDATGVHYGKGRNDTVVWIYPVKVPFALFRN